MLLDYSYQRTLEMRDYSSAFSRSAFKDILDFNDFSHIKWLYDRYGTRRPQSISYLDYLKKIYSAISKEYQCEYVYKNELLGHIVKMYGTKNTCAFNEFRVGNSIVDIALFNGESRAFEIKTEYDTLKRLDKQLDDYKRVFDKCYLVIPHKKADLYNDIDETTGIITLKRDRGHIILQNIREAQQNNSFDLDLLMSCLRTKEYESIIKKWFGRLPDVPLCRMYNDCLCLLRKIPNQELKEMFLTEVKGRRQNTMLLLKAPSFLRQMCLSLNLSAKELLYLVTLLKKTIY